MEQKGKQSDSKFILLCLLHSLTKAEASTQPYSLPHPSPSLNSIRKRIYRLWKYFRSTKKRQASDVKAKSFVEEFFCRWNCWKIKHSEREIEKVFIHRERRWRQCGKKHFHLTFIHYVVEIILSRYKALRRKKKASEAHKSNPSNNVLIVYCLIWARNFFPQHVVRISGEGFKIASTKKQSSLSRYVGKLKRLSRVRDILLWQIIKRYEYHLLTDQAEKSHFVVSSSLRDYAERKFLKSKILFPFRVERKFAKAFEMDLWSSNIRNVINRVWFSLREFQLLCIFYFY